MSCYKPRYNRSAYSNAHIPMLIRNILVSLYFLTHIVLWFHTYVIPYIKGFLLSNKERDFPLIFITRYQHDNL